MTHPSTQELTLACDVLTALEESARLMDENNELFQSSKSGGLKVTIAALSQLSDQINVSMGTTNSIQPNTTWAAAETAYGISIKLLQALKMLQRTKPQLKWTDFFGELRMSVKSTKQEVLMGIGKAYTSLMSRVKVLARDAIKETLISVSDIQENDITLGLKNAGDFRELKSAKKLLLRSMGILKEVNTSASENEQFESIAKGINSSQSNSYWLRGFRSQLEQITLDMVKVKRTRRVLRSLHFENVHTRRQKIPKAHAETFDWIFEERSPESTNYCQFLKWLGETPNKPFWIKGKAGSGKSTLMKYLSSHEEVIAHLKPWAGQQAIVTAGFFFWNSGTPLQKSQMGLLRSLLFEILSQCLELVPSVSRARLAFRNLKVVDSRLEDSDESSSEESNEFPPEELFKPEELWGREELLFVFRRLYREKASANFCFFIDGLDEYKTEGRWDHRDLFETMRALAASPNVKLCLSSRPWADLGDVFDKVFGEDDTWTLQLENLTEGDIRRYVTDTLMENHHFEHLTQTNSSYSNLVKEIVDRANGVFLWVYLVVQELLVGLTYHETLSTMRRRLDAFPKDLEQYFQRMIDMVPTFDRNKSAQTFRIAMSRDEPLFMLTYAFMDELEETPRLQHDERVPDLTLTSNKIQNLQDTMMRRLDGRCRGLMEVVPYHDGPIDFSKYRVDFLHRTVRDYLVRSEDVNKLFSKESEDDCQLYVELCRAICLCLYQSQVGSLRVRRQKHLMPRWLRCVWDELFHFAYLALKDEKNAHLVNEILDDAEISRITVSHAYLNTEEVLLMTACRYGLVKYVRRKLSSIEVRRQLVNNLLRAALRPNKVSSDLNPELVDYLITMDADPNQLYKTGSSSCRTIEQGLDEGFTEDGEEDEIDESEDGEDKANDENDVEQPSRPTTFTWFMGCIADGRLSSKTEGVLKVLWLLLRNGADLNTTVVPSPRKVIDRHFTSMQVEHLLSAVKDNSSSTSKRGLEEALPEAGSSKKVSKMKKNKTIKDVPRLDKKRKKLC